jgi:mRNA interferase MazF
MPPTISYNFGDVVLVPFPFTDQTAAKRRPAVVISSAAYHRDRSDLIIMAITSQIRSSDRFGEVKIKTWEKAGLLKASVIKPVITTIENSLVLKRLGTLADEDREALHIVVSQIIDRSQ